MFRPGNIGHLGRLGLVAASQPSLVAQALAILARYGSAANLYLPGVGAINGITAGNWLDSAGTTAATVDGQVGLVVSAGKYLGPELVENGTFENGTNGWISDNSAVISSVGGNLRVTHGGTSNPYARQSISTVIGRTYSYSVTVRTTSSSAPTSIRAGTAKGGGQNFISSSLTGARTVTAYFVATSSSTVISLLYLTSTPGDFADFDDVSVKEMPGAHLTQSTAANRPILRLAGGVFSWQFDGNNDSFASTMTTGNEGWVCAGTNVQALNPAGAMFVGNGAFSATGSPGMMIYSHGAGGGGFMQLWLSNGVSRQFVGSTVTPTGSAFVFDGGWDASSAAIAINGVEQNLVKTIDPTSAQTIRIGIDPGLFWMLNGLIFATIIMPTVLPTASERATLRQFIASLSGVTL